MMTTFEQKVIDLFMMNVSYKDIAKSEGAEKVAVAVESIFKKLNIDSFEQLIIHEYDERIRLMECSNCCSKSTKTKCKTCGTQTLVQIQEPTN